MTAIRINQYKEFLPLVIFGLVWSFYLKLTSAVICVGDPPELIAAGKLLGVAHPTGYPLFTILLKIFCQLPLGGIAWRANLLSTLSGSAAALLFFLLCRHLYDNQTAFFATTFWVFSTTFQGQSLCARVYVLNIFLTLMVLYPLATNKRNHYLSLVAVTIFGVALGNHFAFLIMFLPLYLWWGRDLFRLKRLITALVIITMGLGLYLELPIRSSADPPANWDKPATWESFKGVVTQRRYRGKMLQRDFTSTVWLVKKIATSLRYEFRLGGVVLLVTGLIILIIKPGGQVVWLFLLSGILNALLHIIYGKPFEFHHVYLLPFYLSGLMLIAHALSWLFSVANRKTWLTAGLALVLFVMIGFLEKFSYPIANRRSYYLAADYGHNLLMSLAPGSTLAMQGDAVTFIVEYLVNVEGKRPDLTWRHLSQISVRDSSRKVFFPFDLISYFRPYLKKNEKIQQRGLLFEIVGANTARKNFQPFFRWRNTGGIVEKYNRLLLAECYFLFGLESYQSNLAKAELYFRKCLECAPKNIRYYNFISAIYFEKGYYAGAIEVLFKASKLPPENHFIYYNLGNAYKLLGDYRRAKFYYEKTLRLKPDFPKARSKLDQISLQLEEITLRDF